MSELLAARALRVGYGTRDVLQAVDLHVGEGELWAVLGPNGAGKSTLLRACLGLLAPRAGTLTFEGRSLEDWPRRPLAQRLAWIPQSCAIEPGYRALDVVLMGRAPYRRGLGLASEQDVQRALRALRELGVEALAGRYADELSGGEQRMVVLARALVQSPRLLLLDEPTAFLDLRHQVEVLARVQGRVRQGLAAVAVLHDVNLAAGFATHVLLLREGAVVAAGRTADVLTTANLRRLFQIELAVGRTEQGQELFAPRAPV